MSDTLNAAAAGASSAGGPASPGRVRVGPTEYAIERPNGRKASTALRLIRRVSATVKRVTKALGEFDRDYAHDHALELDRVQARVRYPKRPVYDADGELVRDAAGEPVLRSLVDAMSEDDWQRAGNVLRIPEAPSVPERVAAVLDVALEEAEDELYRLVALFTLTNEEVARAKRDQALEQTLDERADKLLDDGGLDELLELVVVIGETVDTQFTRKAGELGGRLGNALRLLGLEKDKETPEADTTTATPQTPAEAAQTSSGNGTPSSPSRPTSSTDTDERSDGPPTPPSTPTTASSSPLAPASTRSDD